MAVTLEGVTFGELTTIKEKYEEVGGRDERLVIVSGAIAGKSSVTQIEAALDAILDAASEADYSAELSLRPGRRLYVRRRKFQREISLGPLVGSFVLELEASDPFEVSSAETVVNWTIAASGATKAATSAGNVEARPVIAVTAVGSLVNPMISDGVNSILYEGVVENAKTLVIDSENTAVTLDGEDVTPYTQGEFPVIAPEGTTLTYTDGASSSHTANATITFRDRWW
ncbi:MAG: hypothetical protein AAB353_06080 [Candidatus Hydrogenedentota bacterium]